MAAVCSAPARGKETSFSAFLSACSRGSQVRRTPQWCGLNLPGDLAESTPWVSHRDAGQKCPLDKLWGPGIPGGWRRRQGQPLPQQKRSNCHKIAKPSAPVFSVASSHSHPVKAQARECKKLPSFQPSLLPGAPPENWRGKSLRAGGSGIVVRRAQASVLTDVIDRGRGPAADPSAVWSGRSVPTSRH